MPHFMSEADENKLTKTILQIAVDKRELWAEYRALISAEAGDTSFHSFVKWLLSNINQVRRRFSDIAEDPCN